MTKSKTTKRALLASCLSLLLCCAMLIGSTFAWFTDTVTSGVNKIVAGNLDVKMEYKPAIVNADGTVTYGDWTTVDETTTLFNENALWEPGHTEVVYLKVRNVGSLALIYQFSVDKVGEEIFGWRDEKQPDNKITPYQVFLSDYLVFGQIETDAEQTPYESREAAWKAAGDTMGLGSYASSGIIEADGPDKYITLVVYMPTTVGNEANYTQNGSSPVPSLQLGVNLKATQAPVEYDSFNNQYDAIGTNWYEEGKATNTYTLTNGIDLRAFAAKAKEDDNLLSATVTLSGDADLGNREWEPIGTTEKPFTGKFDGKGHTVSGLKITSPDRPAIGLFGTIENALVENVVVDGVINVDTTKTILTNVDQIYVSGVVGKMEKVSTISKVTNSVDITAAGDLAQVGGITGDIPATVSWGNNCTVKNCLNIGNIDAKTANMVGGISPTYYGGTLYCCINIGTISSDTEPKAGIIGGSKDLNPTACNCYSLIIEPYLGYGHGLPEEAMKTASTFTGLDESVWLIVDGAYPSIKYGK